MESSDYNGEKAINLLEAKRIIGLKIMAYNDYIAARVLFNNDLLHQACFFANTSIEKELKCYLEVIGPKVTISHQTDKLHSLLSHQNKNIAEKINPDFLKALSKIYLSRYFENLSPGYNFIILRNKLLAELDYTFSILESLTQFRIGTNTEPNKTSYESDKEKKIELLLKNNYILSNLTKDEFLSKQELAYEFRILPNHEILEVLYKTNVSLNDSKFLYESLKPADNHSVLLANLKKVD